MGHEHETVSGVSFDLFGTLVTVDKPSDPAESLAHELEEQGVAVPDDWTGAFDERHIDNPDGAEISLTDHVVAALASRTNTLNRASVRDDVERAVWSVFDPGVRTRGGAATTVETLGERLPVGVLSNCSVRELAERAIERTSIDRTAFDVVTTSVDCGWRTPDLRAFRAVAEGLDTDYETERMRTITLREPAGASDAPGSYSHLGMSRTWSRPFRSMNHQGMACIC